MKLFELLYSPSCLGNLGNVPVKDTGCLFYHAWLIFGLWDIIVQMHLMLGLCAEDVGKYPSSSFLSKMILISAVCSFFLQLVINLLKILCTNAAWQRRKLGKILQDWRVIYVQVCPIYLWNLMQIISVDCFLYFSNIFNRLLFALLSESTEYVSSFSFKAMYLMLYLF